MELVAIIVFFSRFSGIEETKVVPHVVVSRYRQGQEEDVVLEFF